MAKGVGGKLLTLVPTVVGASAVEGQDPSSCADTGVTCDAKTAAI